MIALEDWRFMKSHGIPPAAGGRLDQDPRFLDACQIIDDEQTRDEIRQHEKNRKTLERQR